MKRRTLCHILATLFGFSFVVPVTYMALDREPPIELYDGVTVPDQIERGENYRLRWVAKRNRSCPGTVYHRIIDSQNILWSFADSPALGSAIILAPTPTPVAGVERTVPSNIALGPATIITTAEYACNFTQWLYPIYRRWPDIKTTIVDKRP